MIEVTFTTHIGTITHVSICDKTSVPNNVNICVCILIGFIDVAVEFYLVFVSVSHYSHGIFALSNRKEILPRRSQIHF